MHECTATSLFLGMDASLNDSETESVGCSLKGVAVHSTHPCLVCAGSLTSARTPHSPSSSNRRSVPKNIWNPKKYLPPC